MCAIINNEFSAVSEGTYGVIWRDEATKAGMRVQLLCILHALLNERFNYVCIITKLINYHSPTTSTLNPCVCVHMMTEHVCGPS